MGAEKDKLFNAEKLLSLHNKSPTTIAESTTTYHSEAFEWHIKDFFLPSPPDRCSPDFALPRYFKSKWCIRCSGMTFFVDIKYNIHAAYSLLIEDSSANLLGSLFEILLSSNPKKKCTISKDLTSLRDDTLIVKVCLTIFTYNTQEINQIAEHNSNVLLTHLLDDLSNILNNGNFSDIILKSNDGQEIPAHGCLLAARSSVFAAMLSHDMKENKERCIQIDDADSSTIKALLQFMYTGKYDQKVHGKMEVFILADKYDVKDLRELCEREICNNITDENVVDVSELAKKYNNVFLEEKVVDFMNNKIKQKLNSTFWKNLQSEKPSLISEIIQLINKKDSVTE